MDHTNEEIDLVYREPVVVPKREDPLATLVKSLNFTMAGVVNTKGPMPHREPTAEAMIAANNDRIHREAAMVAAAAAEKPPEPKSYVNFEDVMPSGYRVPPNYDPKAEAERCAVLEDVIKQIVAPVRPKQRSREQEDQLFARLGLAVNCNPEDHPHA